jgi:putative transposase
VDIINFIIKENEMTNYRRIYAKGATWFFTVNLADRRSRLLTDEIEILKNAHRYVLSRHPFSIDAMVVLPDHLHAIWTLPEDDADYSMRWRLIKTAFSRAIPLQEEISESRFNRKERGIWQRRFWEHRIRDEVDYEKHINYVHINPVKHGHVSKVSDWPFSTFHKFVEKGIYSIDWLGL